MTNSINIIDEGYRGEICITLDNLNNSAVILHSGKSFASIFSPDLKPFSVKLVDTEFDDSKRGIKSPLEVKPPVEDVDGSLNLLSPTISNAPVSSLSSVSNVSSSI